MKSTDFDVKSVNRANFWPSTVIVRSLSWETTLGPVGSSQPKQIVSPEQVEKLRNLLNAREIISQLN
jgi:hypothetical protein